jgi:hypothetical protein
VQQSRIIAAHTNQSPLKAEVRPRGHKSKQILQHEHYFREEIDMNGPFGIAELGVYLGMLSVMGTLAVILIIVLAQLRSRRARAEMLHKERLLAIEKGIPIPSDYLETRKKRQPYIQGLVWTAVGLGLMLWGLFGTDRDLNGLGFIPFLVGIALLIGDFVASKRVAHQRNGSEAYHEAPVPYRAPDNPS